MTGEEIRDLQLLDFQLIPGAQTEMLEGAKMKTVHTYMEDSCVSGFYSRELGIYFINRHFEDAKIILLID